MSKRRLGPCITFFPQPTTLIASRADDGRVNVMTASWVGLVSKTPPTLGVSLHKGRLTYAQISASGSFTVNLVPVDLAVAADYCGLVSGRDQDKAAVAGLTLVPADLVAAPLVAEAPLNVECRLAGEVELGDYRLLLGEIVQIHALEKAFRADGTLDAAILDPLVYLGGIREYWSLGERKGVAYKDGKALLKTP